MVLAYVFHKQANPSWRVSLDETPFTMPIQQLIGEKELIVLSMGKQPYIHRNQLR
jgi:hypothetical protein